MKTRLLRPEENWKSNLTMAVAFEGDYDLEKAKESAARERTEEEKREDARNRCFGTFLDDDETICGVVNSREYLCRFDGGTYKLGGVGGVSTLPQYRRGGVIRACMTASLKDMYANDFTFAFLYPFSMQYYRKFGFEAGAPEYRWSVPFTAMKPQDVGGHVKQIFPGGDFTPLLTVYNAFYADHNLSAVRETYDKGLEKANLWNDKRYVFVWYNNENQPRGLMITHKIEEDGVTYLDCTHTFQSPGGFLACDAEAFNGLLFFAKSAFSSDYEKLRFTVPSDKHLEQLIGENTRTFCSVFPNGMLRVVNVERVLENCACRGTGEITLRIEDDIITENNGTWRLRFAPGEQNKVEKTDAVPDLILNIRAFSALITGARAAADIPWMPDVRLLRQAPAVPNIFYPKKCSMMDLF